MYSKKNKVMAIVFGSLAIFFMIPSLCAWLFLLDGWNILAFLVEIFSVFIFAFSCFMLHIYSRGFSPKYYFLGRSFKKQVNASLEKFGDMPKYFVDNFVSTRKNIYKRTGKIFEQTDHSWIYKNERSKDIIVECYTKLLASIDSKGGFVEFINGIQNLTNGVNDEYFEGNYEIMSFMCNDLISNELIYLIKEVYNISNFRLYDNKIYADFTNSNNEVIKRLNEDYSPCLFRFREEIENALKTIEKNTKQN